MNETITQSWWFISLGYLSFFVYFVSILSLSVLVEKKTKIDKQTCRKLAHVVAAFVWIICYFFFRCSIHWVIINGIGTVLFAFITFGNGFEVYERSDAKKSYGIFFYGLTTFIVALICLLVYTFAGEELGMKLYYAAGIAYFCLSLGDGLAPIVASAFKKHNPVLMEGRTLAGTLTVFVVSFLSTAVFSAVFNLQLDFVFMLSIAALTAIAEFYGIRSIDNILIDFFVFGYVTLYYFGLVTPLFQAVVIVSFVLTIFAFLTDSFSFSGGVATLVIFYLVGFFSNGDVLPAAFICLAFLLSAVSSAVSKKIGKAEGEKSKEGKGRTGAQILAVGLLATVGLILHYVTKQPVFYLLYFVCLAEQFADSVSSDIGYLTKGKTVDVLRWKPIPKGISGGVSLLGTSFALLSSGAVLLLPYLMRMEKISFVCYLAMVAVAFFGTLLDSVFGSLWQACYKCPVCGALTESDSHCGAATELVKGFACVKNITVNFMAGIGSFLLGLLLIFVI